MNVGLFGEHLLVKPFEHFYLKQLSPALVSPRLQTSVKAFSSCLGECRSVDSLGKPNEASEARGDIFKDSGKHAAILVSHYVNVTLLTSSEHTRSLSFCLPAGGAVQFSLDVVLTLLGIRMIIKPDTYTAMLDCEQQTKSEQNEQ